MAVSFRILLSIVLWICTFSMSISVTQSSSESSRCAEGRWSQWGPWTQQSCSVTCCGADQFEARRRFCRRPNIFLCRSFPGCEGDAIQSRTTGNCNDIDCPVTGEQDKN